MRPIWNGSEYVMVRNIGTALSKDALCTLPLDTEQVARKWLGAVGECGLALTSGIPIMQSFYSAFVRNGLDPGKLVACPQMQSGLRMMRGNIESRSRAVTAQSRLEVFIAWGITPEEQIAIEAYYDCWEFEYGRSDIESPVAPIFHVI